MFDGQAYYELPGWYKNKRDAQRKAASARKRGHLARVVRIDKRWWVFTKPE